jgi:hypothetical protein
MSHRVAFFLAGMVTIGPLQRLASGVSLETLDLLPVGLGWILVAHQWRERKTFNWQLRNAEGYGHHSPFDLLQTRFDRLLGPTSMKASYSVLAILAAMIIYLSFRG